MDIQFIGGVITIIGSMFGMLKFMLKDIKKEVELIQDEIDLIRKEQSDFREDIRFSNKKFENVNNRLDGLYRILLDKTYGKSIPKELQD